MKTRSPIERMVDRACGVPDDYTPQPRVTLECSDCKRTVSAVLDPTDPPGTAKIVMLCPECAKGDRSMIDYFDKDGKQLGLPGDPRETIMTFDEWWATNESIFLNRIGKTAVRGIWNEAQAQRPEEPAPDVRRLRWVQERLQHGLSSSITPQVLNAEIEAFIESLQAHSSPQKE